MWSGPSRKHRIRDSLGVGICGERQKIPTLSNEAIIASGGLGNRAALSTVDKHSGEGARPSVGVHQAISEGERLLPGS